MNIINILQNVHDRDTRNVYINVCVFVRYELTVDGQRRTSP